MTTKNEVPRKKQAINIELEEDELQALRVEAMQRTIEEKRRVPMTEIVRAGIAHELSKRKR